MRKHTVILLVLLLLQFLSTIAFAQFVPHIVHMWYNPQSSLFNTIKAEYALGGWIMVLEFIVIGVVLLGTAVFEVWLLVSGDKEISKNNRILEAIAKKLGVNESEYNRAKSKSEPRQSDHFDSVL